MLCCHELTHCCLIPQHPPPPPTPQSDQSVARQAWLGHEQVSMKARLGQLLERGQLSTYDAELVQVLRLGEDITDKTRWGHGGGGGDGGGVRQ